MLIDNNEYSASTPKMKRWVGAAKSITMIDYNGVIIIRERRCHRRTPFQQV
jgi:hypothetical protein